MLIKIFSLPFDSVYGGFNDEEMRSFLKDKELISVRDYLFVRNDIPYLAFVLKYFPHRPETQPSSGTSKEQHERRDEWRKLLTDADMAFFNILRDWRSKRCKKDGIPPYAVFNNLELAHIVKSRPQNVSELMQIKGIGKAKVDKYGAEILDFSKVNVEGTPEKVGNDDQ